MKSRLLSDYNKVFWAAIAATAIIILPVMFANNGNLYLVGDYMSQQIPFIRECRRMLLSGEPFWSSNTFLGANFLGAYSFYNYGSPFYWPLYLMPEALTGIGLSITFVLRHGVAALTSFIYLKSHCQNRNLAFIGAFIYTFSSFTMDSTYFFHFIDVIAVFPLLLYLVDEALENRKTALMALAVMLNAMINYYFFFSTSVFFLIYLAFRILSSNKAYSSKDGIRCIIYYALGALAAMFILMPSALSLLETHKATNSFSSTLLRGLGSIPQLIKILKGIVLPSEGVLGSANGFVFSNFNSNAAFLPFFGAVFLLIAVRKKKPSEWYYKLIKFLFILTLVPFGNGIFSFFTNFSYTRWWYAFVLISVLASIKVIEEKPDVRGFKKSAKTITIISAAVIGGPLLIKLIFAYALKNANLDFIPQAALNYLENAGMTSPFTTDDLRYCITLILMTAASYFPLWMFTRKGRPFDTKKAIPVVAIICIFSYSVYLSNEARVFDIGYNDGYKGADTAVSNEISYTSRTSFEGSFSNYSSIANKPSISAFHSFKSHSAAEFCRLAGYSDTLHINNVRYFDTPAIQTVLSVEKTVDKDGNEKAAPYYSPFGYSYGYYVLDEGFEHSKSKKENNRRIELMTKACIIDAETAIRLGDVIKPLNEADSVDWEEACKENRSTAATDFVMTSKGFTAVTNGNDKRLIYFSIPHDNGWKAYVDGKQAEIFTLNGGLMGIVVPEGESEIEFIFTTPGLCAGIAVSAVSLLLIAALSVINKKKKHTL